jgi:hypothetical protein
MCGIPRATPAGAERAADFFSKLEETQKKVSDHMNALHTRRAEQFAVRAREPPVYTVGKKVWVLRPRTAFTPKLLSWWIGPCPLVGRVGERTYVVEVKRHKAMVVHAAQLKPFVPNPYRTTHYPLWQFLLSDKVERGDAGPDQPEGVEVEPEVEWPEPEVEEAAISNLFC